MSLQYFQTLTSYNHWANEKAAEFVMRAGDAVAQLEQKSSFPSVMKTMMHIWDAETIWLSRLKGASLAGWPSKNFSGSLLDACNGFVSGSELFETHVRSLTDEQQLTTSVPYSNLKGEPFSSTVQEVVSHCMNHSTFHRGQLITLLRGAGYNDLGSTDMITFYRERR